MSKKEEKKIFSSYRSQLIYLAKLYGVVEMQVGYKKNLAKNLAGITNNTEEPNEPSDYFKRVFKTKDSVL